MSYVDLTAKEIAAIELERQRDEEIDRIADQRFGMVREWVKAGNKEHAKEVSEALADMLVHNQHDGINLVRAALSGDAVESDRLLRSMIDSIMRSDANDYAVKEVEEMEVDAKPALKVVA